MDKLLATKITEGDVIYAHVKGKTKVVTLIKTESGLGVRLTDNGTGYAFIKKIKDNSIMSRHSSISIGDHIEQIDKQSMVGMTHDEVAPVLRDIPLGSTFKIYLVEPKQKAPKVTSSEHSHSSVSASKYSHSKAQVHIPAVDLTADKSCNACQINDITNPAVVYCKACREFYCTSCRDCHKSFKMTRDHVLAVLSPKPKDGKDKDLQEGETISDVVIDSDFQE